MFKTFSFGKKERERERERERESKGGSFLLEKWEGAHLNDLT